MQFLVEQRRRIYLDKVQKFVDAYSPKPTLTITEGAKGYMVKITFDDKEEEQKFIKQFKQKVVGFANR